MVEKLKRYRVEEVDKADIADGAGPLKLELIPKAVESRSQEIVAYLLDAGANINYT